MQSPSSGAQPQEVDTRAATATLARNALLFVCGVSPKSATFAAKRMQELFGVAIDEADLRAAQMEIVAESTAVLMSLLRKSRA